MNPIPDVFAISVAIPTDGEFPTAVTSVDPEVASLIRPTISVIISDLLKSSYIADRWTDFQLHYQLPGRYNRMTGGQYFSNNISNSKLIVYFYS